MTRVVAFDTSTWIGSVALVESTGGAPVTVGEIHARAESAHAAQILALFEALLGDAGWTKTSIDVFAATRGPGSFTGLRVGLGTIRGLSFAAGRAAIGVGTLDAMAESWRNTGSERLTLLDAWRGEVFGARFDASSSPPRALVPAWVGPVERALEGDLGCVTVIANEGFTHLPRLRAAGYTDAVVAPKGTIAAAAGRVALARLRAGASNGDGLAPLYLRPPDAALKPPASRTQ